MSKRGLGYQQLLVLVGILLTICKFVLFDASLVDGFQKNHDRLLQSTIVRHRGARHVSNDSGGDGEKHEVSSAPSSRFAYMVVMGGCDVDDNNNNPKRRPRYLGFLYHLCVMTKLLRDFGSTADVIVLVQTTTTTSATLPDHESRLLHQLGIQVRYLPSSKTATFYDIVLQKFQALRMTEYERVLVMDGDILPTTNLDLLFELSTTNVLRENVIVAGAMEPANAGFFLVQPNRTDYERVMDTIRQRERQATLQSTTTTSRPHYFDEVNGWGHRIEAPDYWRTLNGTIGKLWNFHFAFSGV